MNNNNKMSLWQYILHDNKTVSLAAVVLAIGMTINLLTQEDEGQYMQNTAFWLWLGFGVALPCLIAFYVIRGYRDYLNGTSL